jgi:hypothetical protein
MADYITDVIDIPELVGYVREQTQSTDIFSGILPAVEVDDIEYELRNIDTRASMQVAKYRSWDTAPPLGKRPGFTIIGGEIPPLGLSVKLGEKDIARINKLRAGVADEGGPAALKAIYDDAVNMVRAVYNRLSWAQIDLLLDGIVTIESSIIGPTNAISADFSLPGTHVVTAGTLWSDTAASTPVTNLAAWQKVFRADNAGANPLFWMVSSQIVAELGLNAQVRNLSPSTADGGVRGIVTEQTVAQVMSAHNIAPLVVVDDELPATDDSGTLTRVLPERKVIGVGANLGNTIFGVSPNAGMLAGEGVLAYSDAKGVVAFVEKSIRPAAMLTTGEAVALPVLKDPNALFVATV